MCIAMKQVAVMSHGQEDLVFRIYHVILRIDQAWPAEGASVGLLHLQLGEEADEPLEALLVPVDPLDAMMSRCHDVYVMSFCLSDLLIQKKSTFLRLPITELSFSDQLCWQFGQVSLAWAVSKDRVIIINRPGIQSIKTLHLSYQIQHLTIFI